MVRYDITTIFQKYMGVFGQKWISSNLVRNQANLQLYSSNRTGLCWDVCESKLITRHMKYMTAAQLIPLGSDLCNQKEHNEQASALDGTLAEAQSHVDFEAKGYG